MPTRFRVLDSLLLLAVLFCAISLLARVPASELPRILPAVPVRNIHTDARSNAQIAALQSKIRRAQIFEAYRKLIQIYVNLGRYDDAAALLREEAAQYRRKGLVDAAIIEEQKAAQLQSALQMFVDTTQSSTRNAKNRARLEPSSGCYLGAFIDRDDALQSAFFDENWQSHGRSDDWARLVGKAHASYFMYLKYGQKFPFRWVRHLREQGAIPHIAWEPTRLSEVRDDAYLRGFARDLASANWPVFVRFASEMNGFWTPYHGDAKLYREKFRLIHRVLHEAAPLAATIWCVGNPPLTNIQKYYPGDDACDWVGVNFYSVPFHENDVRRPAFDENPLALLDPIYKSFAARKPIAICEYAASHRAALDGVARADFAVEKMSLLYGALPRLYPRVKLVDWFSMNTIRHASVGKSPGDYSLSSDDRVLDAYRRAIDEPYFLSRWNQTAPNAPRPLQSGQTLRVGDKLSIWAKTRAARPKLYLKIGDKIVYAAQKTGAHFFTFDGENMARGAQNLTAYLFDDRNRFVRSVAVRANFQP